LTHSNLQDFHGTRTKGRLFDLNAGVRSVTLGRVKLASRVLPAGACFIFHAVSPVISAKVPKGLTESNQNHPQWKCELNGRPEVKRDVLNTVRSAVAMIQAD
jgi:hypothetical protein